MSSCGRLLAVLVCAGMLTVLMPSVGRASEEVEAAAMAPVTLIVGIPQTVDNLNPLAGYNNIDYQSYMLQFDFLYHFDKNYTPVPAAAESWSHSDDGKIWTFNIRHGMTFHDGVNVTAADVNWTFNLMLTDEVAGALYIDLLRNVTSVKALDDYTVQFTCNPAKANMLGMMVPILPMHLWSKVPANKLTSVGLWDTKYFPNGPIGSGPFRLVEYATDSFIRYTKHPGYYGGTVHFDELIYKIYINPQVMQNDLIAGYIDAACSLPKESWTNTINLDHIDGQVVRQPVMHELGFNVCPPDLRASGGSTNYETLNRSVRKAVAMAVNKSEIIEKCYFGLGEVGDVLVPPVYPLWHYNLTPAEEYKFDLTAANALLNSSGYPDTDGDGRRENSTSGVELNFKFLYATDYPEDQSAATRISRWLEAIGIKATPFGELESQLFMDWIAMKYDMFIWNWGADVDPTFILSVMTSWQIPTNRSDWSAWSDCFYSNPYYDQLFLEQQTTLNTTARQQIVFEMQRILYKDAPYVIFSYPHALYAYRDDKFTNWPTIESDAVGPFCGTAGGPWFFYEMVPIGANLPPRDVSAGGDTRVALNETRAFTGSATDPDNDTLTYTWQFMEPNGTVNTLVGKTVSYTFLNEGTVTVKLSVWDGVNTAVSVQIIVTVIFIPNAGFLVGYVKDSLGAPLTAALVSVPGTSATTNADGYYNMTLAIGAYNVSATAQGYQSATEVAVISEGQETMVNFSLTSTSGSLEGHVYDAETGDALGSVTISAKVGEVTRLAVSDDDGAYEILLIPAGTCTVTASKSGYDTNSTFVEIVAGQEKVMDIELTPASAAGKGLSNAAWAAIGAIVAGVVITAAALILLRRKKAAEPPSAPKEPPRT